MERKEDEYMTEIDMSQRVPYPYQEKPRDTRTPEQLEELKKLISRQPISAQGIRNLRRLRERPNPYLGQ